MQFVIGLDIGTTACKAIALDERGQVVASTQESYALSVPQPGWVEQQSEEIWHAVAKGLTHLSFHLPTASILALGVSGAMHSVMMLDGHDEPLSPAITWADQRAEACAQALRAQVDSLSLYQRTGCPLQPMYHPAKVRWCVDMAGKRFARIVSIKEYMLHRLTGGITHSLAWSQIVCNVLGVPIDLVREADASALGAARTTFVALSQPLPFPQEAPMTLVPDPSRHAIYSGLHQAFRDRYQRT